MTKNDSINDKIKKAASHISQNEDLIFEKSSPGKKAYKLRAARRARRGCREVARRHLA